MSWPCHHTTLANGARNMRGVQSGTHAAVVRGLPWRVIDFPNPSRSYDAGRRGVRFWGYDSVLEVVFRIDYGALARISADVQQDAVAILARFDRHRERILRVAAAVYRRHPSATCELVAADF